MKIGLFVLGGLVLLGNFGCAPRLAQSSLGNEEQRWQKHIKASYPAWNPPQTTPPTISDNATVATKPVAVNNLSLNAAAVDIEQPKTDAGVAMPAAVTATTEPAPVVPSTTEVKTYTVQKGDTLSAISVKMYNSSSEVKRILEANRDIIKDKNIIRPGMKLVIPVQ